MNYESLNAGSELPVMETFYSVQGEGYHAGKPAYFIRIGGCDVGCHWCDVKESWNSNLHPLVKVDSIIQEALQFPAKAAVITGGEPLNYQLDYLTSELRKNGVATFLETSGSSPLSGKWDWICLSPKRNNPPLAEIYSFANELKIIIHDDSDFEWAEEHSKLISKKCYLFLQPEWSNRKLMIPKIVDFALLHPQWNISIQIHKYMNIP